MSTSAKAGFKEQQVRFAAHIRDPENHPPPEDVEDRRMAVYRDLFYRNVEGFLSGTFPVLRRLMDDNAWHSMARDFYAKHRCDSPLFLEIPREFLNYLDQERNQHPEDPPFLQELAHYEWVELAVSVAEADMQTDANSSGADDTSADALLDARALLSPLAWPLAYQYPVHRISPDFIPATPGEQPTYLLVFRNGKDAVEFIELNPVSARLFALLQEERTGNGRQVLEQISSELKHPQPQVVIDGGRAILHDWYQRGIVIGTDRTATQKKQG